MAYIAKYCVGAVRHSCMSIITVVAVCVDPRTIQADKHIFLVEHHEHDTQIVV